MDDTYKTNKRKINDAILTDRISIVDLSGPESAEKRCSIIRITNAAPMDDLKKINALCQGKNKTFDKSIKKCWICASNTINRNDLKIVDNIFDKYVSSSGPFMKNRKCFTYVSSNDYIYKTHFKNHSEIVENIIKHDPVGLVVLLNIGGVSLIKFSDRHCLRKCFKLKSGDMVIIDTTTTMYSIHPLGKPNKDFNHFYIERNYKNN